MKSYCSLDFSYLRNLHPGFSVSLYSCRLDHVFCMLKSYSRLFVTAIEPRDKAHTSWPCALSPALPPRKAIKNNQISSLSPRRQQIIKIAPEAVEKYVKMISKSTESQHAYFFLHYFSHQILDFGAPDIQKQTPNSLKNVTCKQA